MNPQIMLLAAEASSGRIFGLDQQTAIQIGIQLVNTGILAFFLSKILYKPVSKFLQNRTDRITSQFDDAKADMSKANELRIEYEGKLKDIEAEREKILDSARKLAAEKSSQTLAAVKTQADAIRDRATLDAEIERDRVKDEIRQAIIEVSSAMAGKFIIHSIDKETHDRLFAETMAEIEGMTWQKQ